MFREQRARVLGFLRTGRKDQAPPGLPFGWPDWHDFGLGSLEIAERMAPLLSLTWDAAGSAFTSRIGLDPDQWSVTDPHTARMVDEAALAFSDSMNRTTSLSLDRALARTREELHEGVVKEGESVEVLTKRVGAIFDGAEKWRARRIAQTETSRAVHAAQERSAERSGVVAGWEWLLSGDACPTCVAIAARARYVRLGHAFAVIGDDPHYSRIPYPPAHPHCNCSVLPILDADPQPAWSDTLHNPTPATDEEHDQVAALTQARDEATLGRRLKPTTVKPGPKPKPPAAARPARSVRPVPAAPKKPEKPPWQVGTPIDPDRPIGERIAAADHLKAKLEAILGLDDGGIAQARIDALLAQLKALNDESQAYLVGPGLGRSHRDAAHVAALKEFDRRTKGLTAEIEATHEKARARLAEGLAGFLDLPAPSRVEWDHFDGQGAWKTSANASTRKKARDWLEAKIARGPNDKWIEVHWNAKRKVRAYANKADASIMVADNEKAATMVHELGHHVEFRVKGAEKAAQDFLKHRVGNEPLQSLKAVLGGSYGPDEEGRADDFAKAFGDRHAWYVGKHYSQGATEILSMGIEMLYNSPVHFAKTDPEFCKFILGILDGSMRTPTP